MLSPKMQRACRVNETQIQTLSERAQYDHSMVSGLLFIHLSSVFVKISFKYNWRVNKVFLCVVAKVYYTPNQSK